MPFDENTLKTLQVRLDDVFIWPCLYVFKFIVGKGQLGEVTALFSGVEVTVRDSKHGKYVGVTVELSMESSAAVIEIYRRASLIEGLIAL